jgi:4-aminobutyrate aminotransferase
MIGTEFRDANGKPDKTFTKAVQHACIDNNMLILTAGPWDNTIRWIPPLVVTEAQINEGLNIFEDALKGATK